MSEATPIDPFDRELAAIRSVVDALLTIDSAARERVLAYAARRFPGEQVAYAGIAAYQTNQGLR